MNHRRLWLGLAVLVAAIAAVWLIQGEIRGAAPGADGARPLRSVGKAGGAKASDKKVNRLRDESTGADGKESNDWKPDSYEHNLLGDIVNPFDQEELVQLAADPEKDPYRLTDLIHRAAAEKDSRFRYLVDQKNLRMKPAMDLAVSSYDYAVNGNQESLNHILEIHAKQAPGSDSDSLVTLSYIDEWDRTITAYQAHFAQGTDGAGGDAKYAFLLKREYLFPQSYRKFKKQEAEQAGGGQPATRAESR